MWTSGFHSTNLKGPVPMYSVALAGVGYFSAISFGYTAAKLLALAKEIRTMPDFSLSLISTVDLSTARTPSTETHMALAWAAYPPHRFSEATTSSLVISLPLWNRMPWRSLIV